MKPRKEPWQTPVGTVAQLRLRYTIYAAMPAALLLWTVFAWTENTAARLLACVGVGAAFAAFVALHVGWIIGCDQGMLDHAEVATFHARAANTAARQVGTRKMAFKLPQQPRGEGYVYVVAFSTGTVKVGQTEDPKVRLATHRNEAAAFGVAIVNYWISPSHHNFRDNETRLINRCFEISHRSRKEYFHAVGYEQAVAFASELSFFSRDLTQTSVEGEWA